MDSLSEIVDVVIGVDTHVMTHSAAVVDAKTGGVLGRDHGRGHPRRLRGARRFCGRAPRSSRLGDRGHRQPWRRPHPPPPRERQSSSSRSIDRSERSAAMGRSPIRSTRSVPRARRSRERSSARRARPAIARRCRCFLQRAARRSRQRRIAQRQLFALVVAAPEVALEAFGGSARSRCARRRRAPPPPGRLGSRDRPPQRACAISLVGPSSFGPRPIVTRRRSSRSSGRGARTCSSAAASARSSPPPCSARGRIRDGSAPRLLSRCSEGQPRSQRTRGR